MVELRKRKIPPGTLPAEKRGKRAQVSEQPKASRGSQSNSCSDCVPNVGDTVVLDQIGRGIKTNNGDETTLKRLVSESDAGVVLFTYPKASTPGCTRQACLFRDSYDQLTSTGLSIYGLSSDSPRANSTFKTKQNLPYTLLCDSTASFITELGFKKQPKGTIRGVFAVNKDGEVLVRQAGSPDATVEAIRQLVARDSVSMK